MRIVSRILGIVVILVDVNDVKFALKFPELVIAAAIIRLVKPQLAELLKGEFTEYARRFSKKKE
nr:MAG: hypothetical protein [Helarchaeota virus Nidhogg Meg22_1012]URC17357.1 MAG: hypothetical protein [Helarchaeota virus Nidhogg Meg22_1214]